MAQTTAKVDGDGVIGSGPGIVTRGQILQDVATIDWLSFTLPIPETADTRLTAIAFLELLPIAGVALDHGMMGYTDGARLPGGGVVLYHSTRRDMGVHVSLTSDTLALLGAEPGEWCRFVLSNGGHFTRVDVAIDTDQVTMDVISAACDPRPDAPHGDCVTKARACPETKDKWKPGNTIYIGSRSGRRFVRFYDKSAEQGLASGVPDSSPAQDALLSARQAVQDARQAVQDAQLKKRNAEQSRKTAKLSWLTARAGKEKNTLTLTRQGLKDAKLAKRGAESALLDARRAHLVALQAAQEAQQALRIERQTSQGAQGGGFGPGVRWNSSENTPSSQAST